MDSGFPQCGDVEDGVRKGNARSKLEKEGKTMREPLLNPESRVNGTSQTVASEMNAIESLDYEIFENDLFNQDWRSRKRIEIFKYIFLKWALALLIGIFTGVVGFFNNIVVQNIAGSKLLLTSTLLYDGRYFLAFVTFAGINFILAICAAALCAYIAPAAAGSGIPEVKTYLNGIDAHSVLAPSTLFVKIFGSIFGVSAGFVVGKEGPMVHTGACIANLLGQGGSRKYHMTWKWLRYFKNDRDRRDLITCGAAAGVAAAFRAPVGGVLFALEEAASWWRNALLWRAFFTTAVVAVVLNTLTQICSDDNCGKFGRGGLIMFSVNSGVPSYDTTDLIAVVLIGVLGGLLGSLYNYLVDKVLRIYTAINGKGPVCKILLVIAISLVTSCSAYGLPWLTHCTPCPPDLEKECPAIGRPGHYTSFICQPGHYNALASLFLNTNDDAIRDLFSSKNRGEFNIATMSIFFVGVYFLGIITYGIAIPSGLFIPVILAGGTFGRLVGSLLSPFSTLNEGLFSLLGATAFLGGTMRMTVSLCVIVLELTNNLPMLPLLMLVLLISKTVADNFNRGIYDQMVEMKGMPFMEAHAAPYMRYLTAGDICSRNLITFAGMEKVGKVVYILQATGHNGFPVIEEPPFSDAPQLCGLVLRSHLLVLLRRKKFSKHRALSDPTLVTTLHAFDFAKPGLGKGLKVDDLDINEEEMDMYIDLHPITNSSPYTVVETMSLAKAAVLFRLLGLRHLCVVPKTTMLPPVVGILTRHDFQPEHVLKHTHKTGNR